MLAARGGEQAKPERVLLSPDEYPGTLPGPVAVLEAERLRQQGNTAYASGEFEQAVQLYSSALLFNPTDHLAISNRSACWFRLERPVEALDDAELCVKLAPGFAKGHLRKGTAEQLLNRRVDAQDSFRKGLSHDAENVALQQSLKDVRTEAGGGLQATLYHVLFVSPHLQMDRLFQVLEDPDSLTASYVEEHKAELDAQFECLTQTLGVDVGLLLTSPVLRDAYDRVTFACGQLLQWAPEAVSRHLTQAKRIVEGLGLALRCGWKIHHGVAKFSANALTILATSEGACDKLRRYAVRLLLGGILRWLLDPTPEPEDPPEDRDVCGCSFLCPRLSAATWMERLFEHGTRPWVREECERFPDIMLLVIHLCLVVRDERAVPLGLPCLLRLPGIAREAMSSQALLDLSTCNRDLSGKRDSRQGRWLTRQRGKGGGGNANATAAAAQALGAAAAPTTSTASGSAAAGSSVVGAPAAAGAVAPTPEATAASAVSTDRRVSADASTDGEVLGAGGAASAPGSPGGAGASRKAVGSGALRPLAVDGVSDERLPAPKQRLGEWMMASLGYLLVFIDDDALFAAHACSALRRLALAAPDCVGRLTGHLWMGLPLLERLSALACQHTAALELLETLARHSGPARVAMCSLANALAARPQDDISSNSTSPAVTVQAVLGSHADVGAEAARSAQASATAQASTPPEAATAPGVGTAAAPANVEEPTALGSSASSSSSSWHRVLSKAQGTVAEMGFLAVAAFSTGLALAAEGEKGACGASSMDAAAVDRGDTEGKVVATVADQVAHDNVSAAGNSGAGGGAHDHDNEGLGEPSWVECYHELRDELWIKEEPSDEAASELAAEAWDCAAAALQAAAAPHGDCDGDGEEIASTLATASRARAAWQQPSPVGLVTLGNFDKFAPQVPVDGLLTLFAPSSSSSSGSVAVNRTVEARPPVQLLQVGAVPAVWNPRFDDVVESRLEVSRVQEHIGSDSWREGKDDAVVLLLRSTIQRTPMTPDWASAVWLCADAGAVAVVVVNDLPDDGPNRPAFRMGLFGSPAPPIAAFMISGKDGDVLQSTLAAAAVPVVETDGHPESLLTRVVVHSVRPEAPSSDDATSSTTPRPKWPLILRAPQDIAQAWSLVETVHRAAPSPDLAVRLSELAAHMGLPEKRVWLTRRLQRYHRGDTDADEPVDPQLAFVECDRDGDQLHQLRKQLAERTGVAATDVTGEFEVRFREESSVGSAVMREWMDMLAQQAFLLPSRHLLVSYDGGSTFLPDPAAPFLNSHWRGDFELLGRLLGLAFWHQVTLDLPLHPYVCKLLLLDGDLPEPNFDEDIEEFAKIDPELQRHKVKWLLSSDVADLGYDMPFTDTLLSTAASSSLNAGAAAASETVSAASEGPQSAGTPEPAAAAPPLDATLPALPEVVSPHDMLPGIDQAPEPPRLRPFKATQVALVPGGESHVVTEENKQEFVEALLEWRLRTSMRGPVEEILRGLRAALPSEVLAEANRMLSADEVHSLLAGTRDIDVNDWERNTRTAGGLSPASQEVRWFWQTVRQWAANGHQDRLQDLLQFATGSRRVPVGGFAQLVGFNGAKHLFTLVRGAHLSPKSLPTSHACICTIDIPPWDSSEAAQQKLEAAVEAGRARFDEGMARGNDSDD